MGKKKDTAALRGFYRLQIVEDEDVVGDSGWRENVIVNTGFENYLIKALAGASGSTPTVGFIALGYLATRTFTATDASMDATLQTYRMSAATATSGSTTRSAQFTAAFSSGIFGAGTAYSINEIGLFNASNTTGASAFALATYDSSSVASNQAVNVTYNIAYGTA